LAVKSLKKLQPPGEAAAFLLRSQRDMSAASRRQNDAERSQQAMAEMERYCADHPRSPSAARRPRIMIRGRSCVALLGSTLQDGIVGIGGTIEAALRAFDVQYSNSVKPRSQ